MSVIWHDRAQDQLADIWVTSDPAERDIIEHTIHEINSRLNLDPQFIGESIQADERVWFHHPLVVRFRLLPGGDVRVLHLARLRPWTANE